MKKTYIKPQTTVVKIEPSSIICTSDIFDDVWSETDFDFIGGGDLIPL